MFIFHEIWSAIKILGKKLLINCVKEKKKYYNQLKHSD